MDTFWHKLAREKKPFLVLAPMYDVTDTAFRQVIAHRSRPDVFVTEFVSADALAHPTGRGKVEHLLEFVEEERFEILSDGTKRRHAYLVAQIFGAKPETMEFAARLVCKLGFDGVDINMGCPEKNIQKQGSGAALIRTPELAREIVAAVKRGAGDLPVSVKTRIGYHREEINKWIPEILRAEPDALTVHLRTKKEMSLVPAHWELMPEIVRIREEIHPGTVLIGNGDLRDLSDARNKAHQSGCEGAMLGRAVFGNPWLFVSPSPEISPTEKLQTLIEHVELYDRHFSGVKNFAIMKRHFAAYVRGFVGASKLRAALMETESGREATDIIKEFVKQGLRD